MLSMVRLMIRIRWIRRYEHNALDMITEMVLVVLCALNGTANGSNTLDLLVWTHLYHSEIGDGQSKTRAIALNGAANNLSDS
jgi:hypothetical protein